MSRRAALTVEIPRLMTKPGFSVPRRPLVSSGFVPDTARISQLDIDLTQCVYQSALESRLPLKAVNLLSEFVKVNKS